MWKTLVIDKNKSSQQIIIDSLNTVAKCDVAIDGKEAIENYNKSVKSHPYDIILLDILIPNVNGLEFLTVLRKHEKDLGIDFGDGIPVIIIANDKKLLLEAYNKGCDGYILKPFEPEILIQKIEELLS